MSYVKSLRTYVGYLATIGERVGTGDQTDPVSTAADQAAPSSTQTKVSATDSKEENIINEGLYSIRKG